MDQEIKRKWLAALRSGKYKQGFRGLRPTPTTYCCLGVLCVVMRAKWSKDKKFLKVGTEGQTLPESIQMRAQVARNPKIRMPDGSERSLAELNDGYNTAHRNYSFAEIADLIEAQL